MNTNVMADFGRLQLPNSTSNERDGADTKGLGGMGVLEATTFCKVAMMICFINLGPVYMHTRAS